MMVGKIEIDLENTVTNYIVDLPDYGEDLNSNNASALFDRTLMVSNSRRELNFQEFIGGYQRCLIEGTIADYWQSGVVSGISFNGFYQYEEDDKLKWISRYTSGVYSIEEKEIRLHSDSSYSFRIESKETPVEEGEQFSIAIWARNAKKIKKPYKKYKQGVNASKKSNTYSIQNGIIFFEEEPKKEIGRSSFASELWEDKGTSISSERFLYSNYFPIKKDSLKVVAYDGSTKIELKESKNVSLEKRRDYYYEVDYDLGIIKVGSSTKESLILEEDLDTLSTFIKVKNAIDLNSYPDSGYLISSSGEEIYYESKGERVLEGIVYTGNTILAGEVLTLKQNNLNVSSSYRYYTSYTAVPRVDVEFDEGSYRTANVGSIYSEKLNIKPSSNINNSGVIQISTKDKHVKTLKLRLEGVNQTSENKYDGIYYGSSVVRAIAQALDSEEEGVEGIDITIVIESGPGFLNGGKQVIDTSNSNGEIEAGYFAPYDWNNIKKQIVSSTFNASTTEFEVDSLPSGLSLEEIQIYEVLKTDHNIGTRGELKEIAGKNFEFTNPNGSVKQQAYIEINKNLDLNFDDMYTYSKVVIENSSRSGWVEEEIDKVLEKNDSWVLFLKSSYNPLSIANLGNRCFLFRKKSQEWSGNSRQGLTKLLYRWNDNVTHPVTSNPGAYYPLRPSSVSGTIITYDVALSQPQPYNRDEILGDYVILSSGQVTMYAWCKDPYTGQTIVSNRVYGKIEIPRYLNGVDFSESLPVPYGFRLRDANDDVSSGVGGMNFLSINTLAQNKLSLGLQFNN